MVKQREQPTSLELLARAKGGLCRRHREGEAARAQGFQALLHTGERRRVPLGVFIVVMDVGRDEEAASLVVSVADEEIVELIQGGAQVVGDGGFVDADADVAKAQRGGAADRILRVNESAVEVKDYGVDAC